MIFLDDMLLMTDSREELEVKSLKALTPLRILGFRINWEKSQLSPTHKIRYLGFMIDTILMTLTLPEGKVQNIKECQSALRKEVVSVREVSRLISMMSATTLAVLPAPLNYREIQEMKIHALKKSQSFNATVQLNEESRIWLQWLVAMLEK